MLNNDASQMAEDALKTDESVKELILQNNEVKVETVTTKSEVAKYDGQAYQNSSMQMPDKQQKGPCQQHS